MATSEVDEENVRPDRCGGDPAALVCGPLEVAGLAWAWTAGRSASTSLRAEEAGLVPGGPPISRDEWAELVRGWFPGLVDANARSLTYAETDAHRGDLVVASDGCFSRHCQQISALGDEHVPQ